jgi:DNA-binding response OmpR family regulator
MITVAGKNLPLSPVEFRIVSYLVENPFRVVQREEMLNTIWVGAEVTARIIDAHLVAIRKALVEFDHEIVSLYGEGYSLRKKSNAKR